jgi:acyl-CoA synthetase (AMP-forming)/AMP-acid ligase II
MVESGSFTIEELIFNRNQDPDHNAIEFPGHHPLTYHDLRLQILYVVKTLNKKGYHRNDRIAVIMPASPETAVIIISVMAGFTCVPLNHQNTILEYETIFPQLKVQAIIVQHDCKTAAEKVAKARNIPVIELIPFPGKVGKFELKPAVVLDTKEAEFASSSDISHVFLTSGTTSQPKIVPISQKQSFLVRQRQIATLKISENDRCLQILPFYHGMGIGLPLLSILLAGGTIICTKDFIPSDFYPLLVTARPTYFIAGPAHHRAILRELKKVPPNILKNNSLRLILSSSASLSDDISKGLEMLLGVPVIEHYASTETGVISINFPPKRGSVGIPVIEHLHVLNENGNRVGPNKEGEIVVKGETVFSGYENAPDENTSLFIDGWFRTCDLGYLDDEGYLFLIGRKKELINKGGEKISPSEIDDVLKSHPQIRDAMTFAISEPLLGEDIAAMVVPADERITETDLRMFLLDHLIQFKVPRRIYFVDEIPKTPTGKPRRYVGTQRYS